MSSTGRGIAESYANFCRAWHNGGVRCAMDKCTHHVPRAPSDPWQGIAMEKVRLNKYIWLGYISDENLKLVVGRFHHIQSYRQKRFKSIIAQMQQAGSKQNPADYKLQILDTNQGYNHNILFLDFLRYLQSLLHPPTRRILGAADLVYPQGRLMRWAFRQLAKQHSQPQNHHSYDFLNKFDFAVTLLSHLDSYACSIFLLGGNAESLARVEQIFKTSFGNIKVLGKSTAKYYRHNKLDEVRTVINKSFPTLSLVAKKARIHDFLEHKCGGQKIKSFLVLDYPEALQDFSGKYRRAGKWRFARAMSRPLSYLIFPWKWLYLLCMLIFILRTLTRRNPLLHKENT